MTFPPASRGNIPIPKPFSIEPILRRVAEVERGLAAEGLGGNGTEGLTGLARLLGVDRQRVYRMRRGGITADQADFLAVMFGCHPTEVWPDWYEQTNTEDVA